MASLDSNNIITKERAMGLEKEKNFVSCILYLHNDGETVYDFLSRICGVMRNHFDKYEIICVNDGCLDNTVSEIRRYRKESGDTHAVSLINLSYYQGMESAMSAGRDLAVGDFLFEFDQCTMDFEEDLIMKVYYRALEGFDVVAAAPKKFVPLSSKMFYLVYNLGNRMKTKMRQERFRIVSRRAVNRVNQMNAYIPYRKALYMNCGLKMDTIVYDNASSTREHNWEEMGTRSSLAMDTIIIFTDLLEKASLLLSAVFLVVLVFMFGYLISSIFSAQKPVEGWLSIMGLMSLGFFMLFVMLTLIFKYLSVILRMMFKRQQYVVESVDKL